LSVCRSLKWVASIIKMIEAPLNLDLVAQSINFHGQQLQKIWEGERGENEMSDVIPKLDLTLIQQRQKKLK